MDRAMIEEYRQEMADLKEALNAILRQVMQVSFLACQAGDKGGAASHACTSSQNIGTLAEWYECFADEEELGIEPEIPIFFDLRWARAVLDTPDPAFWRDEALRRGLSAGEIRREAGVEKYSRKREVIYRGPATLSGWQNGKAVFFVNPGAEAPPAGKYRLGVERVEEEK